MANREVQGFCDFLHDVAHGPDGLRRCSILADYIDRLEDGRVNIRVQEYMGHIRILQAADPIPLVDPQIPPMRDH